MRAVLALFEKVVQLNRSLPDDAYVFALNVEDPGWLADLIVSALGVPVPDRQRMLETFDIELRLQRLSVMLGRELDVLELENRIHSKVQSEVDRSQREYYLREQMKAIQTELGEQDAWSEELTEVKDAVLKAGMPEEVQTKALKELERMGQMPSMAPEVAIVRTYLDWLIELPWQKQTEDNLDLKRAVEVLDRQHYGLPKAKERILEYLAVRSLAPKKQKQPILCFVGPPGTGKTSLGRSIAETLGRKFVRVSLGGVRDEAEIRGHRRTYIGALPGRVLQTMRRAGMVNPLFMLDEIDKLGVDFRGDPAAALLEVLDPEQNYQFDDHYLDVPYDLSRVMFITTANTLGPIPPALLDRMEVIEFPGYIEQEKIAIANRFLIPRQLEENGLEKFPIAFGEDSLRRIIRGYTWEAGVRNLDREVARICRKVARRKAEGKKIPDRIDAADVGEVPRPAAVFPARSRKGGRGRGGHRAGLDRERRRHDAGRGRPARGQGQRPDHRADRRGDAGERPGGDVVPEIARQAVPSRTAALREDRRAHPHPGGRDPQGRAQRRDHDGHRARLGLHRPQGPPRRGDDRRDHPARARPPGRRGPRQDPRRAPGGAQERHHPPAQREGPDRDSEKRPRRIEDHPGRSH